MASIKTQQFRPALLIKLNFDSIQTDPDYCISLRKKSYTFSHQSFLHKPFGDSVIATIIVVNRRFMFIIFLLGEGHGTSQLFEN
jgi:hypothetical protein